MKFFYLLLVLLLLIPFSSASIEIADEVEGEYNLGEEISFSIKITPETTDDALVKFTLKCTNKEILYYITPFDLEEGKETSIDAPPIKAFSEGLCNIRVNVESLEGGNLDGISSEEFTVSGKLELSFTVDKTDVLPGDTVKIEGTASKGEETIEDGIVLVILDGKKEQLDLNGKKFSYELELGDDIKSGEHTIIVEVSDSYENYNEEGAVINVEAIPTSLELGLNGNEFNPVETLEVMADLLDQAGDVIEEKVNVKLFKRKGLFKDEIVIFDTSIKGKFEFTFDYDVLPGDYVLRGSSGELEDEEIIKILAYPKIEMNIEGSVVLIKNVGNVEYDDETTIVLDKDDKTYIINKKIKLDVGEETSIDLSREVSSGSYTVTLPEDSVGEEVDDAETEEIVEGDEKVVGKVKAENAEREEVVKKKVVESPVNVIKNVEIKDNRPLYKKGMDAITGRFIAGAGVLLSRPKFGSFIIIIIILAVVGYFNRRNIKKIIENIRKRREEKY